MSKLCSVSLLSRDAGEASVPHSSGLAVVEARQGSSHGDHRLSWLRCLRELWLSVTGSSHLLYQDVLSLAIQPGRSGCGLRGIRCTYVYSQPAGPAFGELVDIMACATTRLDLAWRRKKREVNPGRLDERFLSGHSRPSLMSLPTFC